MKKMILVLGLVVGLAMASASVGFAGDTSYLLGGGEDRDETVRVMDGDGNVDYYHVRQKNGSVSIMDQGKGGGSVGSWNGQDGHLIDLETGKVKFIHRSGR